VLAGRRHQNAPVVILAATSASTSDMIGLGFLVVCLGGSDALEQLGVRDALVRSGSHAHQLRLVRQGELVAVLVAVLLGEEVASKELVELMLVHDVALVLYGPGVGSLVD